MTTAEADLDRGARSLEVISALSSLIRCSRSIARQRHDQLGASSTPVAILKALSHADAGQDRPGDLAVATGVAPSVVSRALARLEEDGLVSRARDEADARACHISLTPAGRTQLDQIQHVYAEILDDALAAVPAEELDRIPAVLRVLEDALLRAAERAARPRHTSLAPSLRPTATASGAHHDTTGEHH